MNAGVEAALVNTARWRSAPVPQSSRRNSVVMIWVSPRSLSAGGHGPAGREKSTAASAACPVHGSALAQASPCRAVAASAAATFLWGSGTRPLALTWASMRPAHTR